jgi:cobalamin biosynthesis protein CobD
MFNIYILMAAVVLDIILGDPHNMPHPIRFIGNGIIFFEKLLRKIFRKTKKGELFGGLFLVVIIGFLTAIITAAILWLSKLINMKIYYAVNVWICYRIIAMKSLKKESMKVYNAIKKEDLEEGRIAVSMIVGRDTKNLDKNGVIKAAVETVAENTSDGVIAPLIYIMIGGPVLGFIYKAINTMDSMIGYKNEKYLFFGRVAAKLDDAVNFIPSRIAGILMVGAAFLTGMNGKNAWKIFLRDRKNHKSPNSAQTEAACAGALEVELAGDAWYFGKLYKKAVIGDALKEIEAEDIVRVNKLMYVSVFLLIILAFIIYKFLF